MTVHAGALIEMDIYHNEEDMLDAVEPSIEEPIVLNGGTPRPSSGFSHGQIAPLGSANSLASNGPDTRTLTPLQRSPDRISALLGDRERSETNGLVQKVSNLLSIDSPSSTPARLASDEDTDIKEPKQHKLQLAMLPTGLCYDVRMRFHCEFMPANSTEDHHPEEPRRIWAIYQELCKAGLVDDPISTRPLVPQPLLRIMARDATPEEICTVHDARHYEFVISLKSKITLIEYAAIITHQASSQGYLGVEGTRG